MLGIKVQLLGTVNGSYCEATHRLHILELELEEYIENSPFA